MKKFRYIKIGQNIFEACILKYKNGGNRKIFVGGCSKNYFTANPSFHLYFEHPITHSSLLHSCIHFIKYFHFIFLLLQITFTALLLLQWNNFFWFNAIFMHLLVQNKTFLSIFLVTSNCFVLTIHFVKFFQELGLPRISSLIGNLNALSIKFIGNWVIMDNTFIN